MKALGKGSVASIVRIGLQVAWVLLWIGAAFLLIAAAGYGIVLLLVANGVVDASLLQGGDGRIGDSGDFSITYDTPAGATWPVVLPALLIGGVAIGGSLIIVWRLKRLFDSFTSGEPFRRENATHLRVIWITMLVVEVSRYLLMGLAGALLLRFGGPAVSDINFSISGDRVTTWMSILILVVLAEVFREGARLKEEQELTI